MQLGELPQWMDIGPDQDIAGPTTDIVALLKKKMNRKPEGGTVGGAMGQAVEMPQMINMDGASSTSPQKKSL